MEAWSENLRSTCSSVILVNCRISFTVANLNSATEAMYAENTLKMDVQAQVVLSQSDRIAIQYEQKDLEFLRSIFLLGRYQVQNRRFAPDIFQVRRCSLEILNENCNNPWSNSGIEPSQICGIVLSRYRLTLK